MDELLPQKDVEEIYNAFPRNGEGFFDRESFREKKKSSANLSQFHSILSNITYAIQDPKVVKLVSEIWEIEMIEPDPKLYAGGLSMMFPNDYLNPHIDNSHNGERLKYRRLNLLYYVSPDWSFENQNSQIITSEQLNNKIKLVDFFFTSCPTICPRMTLNMHKIQSILKKNCLTDIELLSFTVDPIKDTSEKLLEYANSYNVDSTNWNMLTGDQATIYDLGVNGFLVPNQEDALAPGGFLHSEKLILLDQFNRIRGYYDGTDSLNIPIIVQHIQSLL